MDLLLLQNMVHHSSRVLMKHLSIFADQTSINFDKVFTRPTGFSRSLSSTRRRFREWLPEKFVQLPKFYREPHQAIAQWHAQADQGLYTEFRERSVYKNLLDVSLNARMRQWK